MEATKQHVSLEEAFKLGARNLMEGKYAIAERVFKDILKTNPDHAPSLYNLGLTYYSRRQWPKAAQAFEKSLKQDAGNEVCWNLLGFVRYKIGLNDQAMEALDKSIQIKPDYDEPYKNKSRVYSAEEDYDAAIKAARKATELNPGSADGWFALGNAYILDDDFDQAMAAWNKAIEIDPEFAKVWNNMGEALRQCGKLSEAEEKCREAIKHDPGFAHAYANLGYIMMESGRNNEADKYFRIALEHKPQDLFALGGLCASLINNMCVKEALSFAERALAIDPDSAMALLNRAKCLRLLGSGEAEQAARDALELAPESAEIHAELAEVLSKLGRTADAIALLDKARQLPVESPRLYLKLASAYKEMAYLDEAREMADKAAELNPEIPAAHYVRGSVYYFLGQLDTSLECMNKVIELKPDFLSAYISISTTYLSLGDKKKAEESVREGQKYAEGQPEIYYALQSVDAFDSHGEDFKKLKALEDELDTTNLFNAIALYYSLYRAHEDREEYDDAFEYLKKANTVKGSTLVYNAEEQQGFCDKIRSIFTPEFIASKAGQGNPSEEPIFVVGMPRSGSTLTEQIISSHPRVFGAGETGLLSRLLRKYTSFDQIAIKEMGEKYIESVHAAFSFDEPRFVDKTLENYIYIGQITTLFPNAKIIHSRRDPVDTALSCYKQNFAMGQSWSYDLEDIAAQFKIYRQFMDHWREVLPDRFIEIDYEQTVNNFEQQARRLIDYIGLDWDDACLEPHKQKRQVLTASKTQVTQPIYQSSVKAWKRYEKQMQPFIKAIDYKEGSLS